MHKKTFKSKINGIDGVLKFRALNLADEQWIQETYPTKGNEVDLDLGYFAHVLYRQMLDKSQFSEIKVSDIDDMGREVTLNLGGYKRFMSMVDGDQGKVQLMESFTAVCKMSRPSAGEQKEQEEKKKRKTHQLIFTASFISLLLIIIGVTKALGS
ncbi:MAG: hypothetical protein KAG61_06420 [Bacteriovoracaceae bacterium]|nr:hypothetical protein [Bacteriovoracaceae bacterium]